jgi:hypothetical protein
MHEASGFFDIPLQPKGFEQQVHFNAFRSTIDMGLNFGIQGQNIEEVLNQGLRGFVAGTLQGTFSNYIGEAYGDDTLNWGTHKILHGLAGGGAGWFLGGTDGILPGAMGSMVAEIIAEGLTSKGSTQEQREINSKIGKFSSAVMALLTGSDVYIAFTTGSTAVENNFLRSGSKKEEPEEEGETTLEEQDELHLDLSGLSADDLFETLIEQDLKPPLKKPSLFEKHIKNPLDKHLNTPLENPVFKKVNEKILKSQELYQESIDILKESGFWGNLYGRYQETVLLDNPPIFLPETYEDCYLMGFWMVAGNSGKGKGSSQIFKGKSSNNKTVRGLDLSGLTKSSYLKSTKPVELYEVGPYNNLKNRSKGDGLEVHHAPQQHPSKQIIKGYDPNNAPSIVLKIKEHKKIPNVKGDYKGTDRQLLTQDAKNLRKYTNTPNEKIQDLIDQTKKQYPYNFKK